MDIVFAALGAVFWLLVVGMYWSDGGGWLSEVFGLDSGTLNSTTSFGPPTSRQ